MIVGVGIFTHFGGQRKTLDVLLCQSLPNSVETEYFTESGGRLGVRKPQWSSCLWPTQPWCYRYIQPSLLHGCWGFEFSSSCLHSKCSSSPPPLAFIVFLFVGMSYLLSIQFEIFLVWWLIPADTGKFSNMLWVSGTYLNLKLDLCDLAAVRGGGCCHWLFLTWRIKS